MQILSGDCDHLHHRLIVHLWWKKSERNLDGGGKHFLISSWFWIFWGEGMKVFWKIPFLRLDSVAQSSAGFDQGDLRRIFGFCTRGGRRGIAPGCRGLQLRGVSFFCPF